MTRIEKMEILELLRRVREERQDEARRLRAPVSTGDVNKANRLRAMAVQHESHLLGIVQKKLEREWHLDVRPPR